MFPRPGQDQLDWAHRLITALEIRQSEQDAVNRRVAELESAASGGAEFELPLGVPFGGTGGVDQLSAQTNLGLLPGRDVQAFDTNLAALAGLTGAPDKLPYFTGEGAMNLAHFGAVGKAIAAAETVPDAIGGLGLGTMAFQDASAVNITGGSALFRTIGLIDETDGPVSVAFLNMFPLSTARMEFDLVAGGVTARLVAHGAGVFYVGTTSSHPIIIQPNSINAAQFNVDGTTTFFKAAFGLTAAPGTNTTQLATTAFVAAGFQPLDVELTALAGLASAADKLPYFTGAGAAALADFSGFGRSLVDDADAAAGRGTLGLGTIAVQAANNVSLTGGAISGMAIVSATLMDSATYQLNGVNAFLLTGTNYHAFRDPANTNTVLLGNATDPTNYFQNTTHAFKQRSGGGTNFMDVNASRMDLPATEIRVGGDVGGAASRNTLTGAVNAAANSTGVGTVKLKGATNRDSVGFIKMYVGTTAVWVPYWTTVTG